MPSVTLSCVEVSPIVKSWLTMLALWNPEIEARLSTPETLERRGLVQGKLPMYGILCMEDEIEIQTCLESKIGGEEGRQFLRALMQKGFLPEYTCTVCPDGLADIGLVEFRGNIIRPQPLMKLPQVQLLLKL
jgi:hypothetical protein